MSRKVIAHGRIVASQMFHGALSLRDASGGDIRPWLTKAGFKEGEVVSITPVADSAGGTMADALADALEELLRLGERFGPAAVDRARAVLRAAGRLP